MNHGDELDPMAIVRYEAAIKRLIVTANELNLTMGRILIDVSQEYIAIYKLSDRPLTKIDDD